MSVKITNKHLVSAPFQHAVIRLSQQKLKVDASFKLLKLQKKIDSNIKLAERVKAGLMDKYCQKDEAGKFIPFCNVHKDAQGNEVSTPVPGSAVPIEETKDEFEQKFTEWLNYEHEIDEDALSAKDLRGAEISSADLHVLEPILYIKD